MVILCIVCDKWVYLKKLISNKKVRTGWFLK